MFAVESKAAVAAAPDVSLLDLRANWKSVVGPVESFLEAVARQLEAQVGVFAPEIAPYAKYALANQGKQLRPTLVALSGEATDRFNDDLVDVAVIIEMVHLATLAHDDVMDAGVMRRRRPTLAANWGNEISVLLGDCLFAQAMRLATAFSTLEICRAIATATHTVCTGEILQTLQRGNAELSRAEYFRILNMKTGTLFALSCDLGAGLAGAKGAKRAALRQFGMALGTAYQVYDDCLDLFGSEAAAGKSLGTDLANGKLTLPVLVALERATAAEQATLKQFVQTWDRSALVHVQELLGKYEALAESRRAIHQYLSAARECLTALPETESVVALIGLTDFLAQQTDALGAGRT